MKISLYIPKGTKGMTSFIQSEIATARNIQSKQTKDSVLANLTRIVSFLNSLSIEDLNRQGYKILVDDEGNLKSEVYNGKVKKYYCGKSFLNIEEVNYDNGFIICLVDANDCLIAIMNSGSYAQTIWEEESFVPRKHDAGGQSQRRFEKNRDLALLHWFKKCNEQLFHISNEPEYKKCKILLGIHKCNESRFMPHVHRDVLNRIIASGSVSYVSINGCFELIEKCSSKLKDNEIIKDRALVERFSQLLSTNPDIVDYGINALDEKRNEIIIYSKEISDEEKEKIKKMSCPTKELIGHPIIDKLRICVINKYKNKGDYERQ